MVPCCVTCNGDRARVLQLAVVAAELRRRAKTYPREFPGLPASVRKAQRRQETLKSLVAHWIAHEKACWGSSPTEGLDFSLPVLPAVSPDSPGPATLTGWETD